MKVAGQLLRRTFNDLLASPGVSDPVSVFIYEMEELFSWLHRTAKDETNEASALRKELQHSHRGEGGTKTTAERHVAAHGSL